MSNTSSINDSVCRFINYIEVYYSPDRKDYCRFVYDIKKAAFKKATLRLNMLLGNLELCKCKNCNPDTSNKGI